MTRSLIPYSFTPGTKAKAQEVNANFIALAEKIETNSETIEANKSTAASDTAKCAKKDGNETYTGTKTFIQPANSAPIIFKHSKATIAAPSDTVSNVVLDCNDAAENRTGCLFNTINTDGNISTSIQAIRGDVYNTLGLFIDAEGVSVLAHNGQIMRYIRETYWDGYNWYRLWSDGWIEQGGRVPDVAAYNSVVITLLKPHASVNYTIQVTQGAFNSDATRSSVGIINVATNAFAVGFGNGSSTWGSWMTAGY